MGARPYPTACNQLDPSAYNAVGDPRYTYSTWSDCTANAYDLGYADRNTLCPPWEGRTYVGAICYTYVPEPPQTGVSSFFCCK